MSDKHHQHGQDANRDGADAPARDDVALEEPATSGHSDAASQVERNKQDESPA